MNKNKAFLLLVFFINISVVSYAFSMNCDNCGLPANCEINQIKNYFSGYNISFERDVKEAGSILFQIAALLKCNSCNYIAIPCWIKSHPNKIKIADYIKSNSEIKSIDLNSQPWLFYEHAAKMYELSEDSPLLIGRAYLLAAWTSNQEKLVDSYQMEQLEKILPYSCVGQILETPKITNINENPPVQAYANAILNTESKMKSLQLNENELAIMSLILGNIYFTSNNINKTESYLKQFSENTTIKNLDLMPDELLKISGLDLLKNISDSIFKKVNRSKKYDELARKYFTLALSDKSLIKEEKLALYFLLAELERSLGNYDKSKEYYEKVINEKDTSSILISDINYIFKNYFKGITVSNDKLNEVEAEEIKNIFKKINNDPLHLLMFTKELASFKRRDLVFPKLKEYIESGNDDFIEGAVLAMSDRTQKAIDLQVDLLKKGKAVETILTNLRFNTDLIRETDDIVFIDIFNKEKYPRWNIVSYLVALNTDKCRLALKDKVKKLFNYDQLLQLSKNNSLPVNISGSYDSLLNALSLIKDDESTKIIIDLLNNLNKIGLDSNFSENHFYTTGLALEVTFNKHFGFGKSYSPRPIGRNPQKLDRLSKEESFTNFEKWYKAFTDDNTSLESVNLEGFKSLGYNVEEIDNIDSLKELISGLKDSYDPVRINCYREIVRKTGIMYNSCSNYDFSTLGGNKDDSENYYLKWIEENKEKLTYDKDKQIFIVKKEISNKKYITIILLIAFFIAICLYYKKLNYKK